MSNEAAISRKIKSSLFRALFSQSHNFIDLYEVCSGIRIEADDIRPFDLNSDVIDRYLCNDTSHITSDKRLIVMAEHLSSPKRNVAQRDLLYYTNLVQQWLALEGKSMSSGRKFDIPLPEFYIVYNGKQEFNADYLTFGNSFLRVSAKLVNINFDVLRNRQPNNVLAGYSYFFKQMDAHLAAGASRTEAFKYAIEQCILNGYLRNVVEKEDFIMYQDAVLDYLFPSKERLSWNEGHEEGLEQGELKQLVRQIHKKKLKSKSRQQIIDELEMDESNIDVLDNFDSYAHLLQ